MDTQYNEQELLRLRDTYLNAQKEFVEELNKIPEYRDLLKELQKMSTKDLLLNAAKLVASVENGEVEEKDLEDVELKITLYFDAIQDHVRDKEISFHPFYLEEEKPKKKPKKDTLKKETDGKNNSTKKEDTPKKEDEYEFKIIKPHKPLEISPTKKNSPKEPKRNEPEIEI